MVPASPPAPQDGSWAATRVAALIELWVLIAMHSGVVGAWRLMGVCRASMRYC